jgi:hypothetical protein
LRSEVEVGMAMARDPLNAGKPPLAQRVTTMYSQWYGKVCKVCSFRFREGDVVRLCPKCSEPYHDDARYRLVCWAKHFANGQPCRKPGHDRFHDRQIPGCDFCCPELPPDPATVGDKHEPASATAAEGTVQQFVSGLSRVWQPFGDVTCQRVTAGHEAHGRVCPWCRFELRLGDQVVPCPCGCGAYSHQDIYRHLTCWNNWHGVEGNNFCPITTRPFKDPADVAR